MGVSLIKRLTAVTILFTSGIVLAASMSAEHVNARLAPIGHSTPGPATTAVAADAPVDNADPVYKATCSACHGMGIAGAPKAGDSAAWADRIAQGKDTLYSNAINGLNAMPARGGNPGLSDDEVKAAVDYMVKISQ